MKHRTGLLIVLALALVAAAAFAVMAADSKAPDFTLKDLKGKNVKFSDILAENELVMLDFWFVGCKPCLEYMESFDGLEEQFADRGFKLVTINTDSSQSTNKVKPFMDGRKYGFLALLDPNGEVRKRYQIKAEPTTFLIKKDGTIVYRHQGYTKGLEDEVAAAIDENLPKAK